MIANFMAELVRVGENDGDSPHRNFSSTGGETGLGFFVVIPENPEIQMGIDYESIKIPKKVRITLEDVELDDPVKFNTTCSDCGVVIQHTKTEKFILTYEGSKIYLRNMVSIDKGRKLIAKFNNPVCVCGRVLDDAEAWGV